MGLINTWIGYGARSATQILTSLLTELGFRAPEITDHSPNNPYVRELGVVAGIAEQLGYYIDNAGRESHISTCRLYSSGVKHAKRADYKIKGCSPYTTTVVFSTNIATPSAIVIPAGTRLKTATSDIIYVTLSAVTIPIGATQSAQVIAAQQVRLQTGVQSNATPNQVFDIGAGVVHNSIVLEQAGIYWQSVETFAFSTPTDRHFIQSVNELGNASITFGDDVLAGRIPNQGQPITINYQYTLGEAGKVDVNSLTVLADGQGSLAPPVGVTISVTNIDEPVGGAGVESLDSIRRNIPLHNKTLRRAVDLQDYVAIAEQVVSVARAGVAYSCDAGVILYVLPTGGGIANQGVLQEVFSYVDDRKGERVRLTVRPAGVVIMRMQVDAVAVPGFANAAVQTSIRNAIIDFFNYENQVIGGEVVIGDLYQTIENPALGTLKSVITYMNALPYPRPVGSALALNWTVSVPTTSVSTELFKIQFVTGASFRVIRNSTLIGTYNVGVQVALPEIVFTVNAGTYSNGDTYEFTTYPYDLKRLTLKEPSIPFTTSSDLIINVTGGI